MIYELRIYTCLPGKMQQVLDMWQNEGKQMLDIYFKMVGQWTSVSGMAHQIYTLWEFKDLNHWEEARKNLLAHPGFAEYLERCRACYLKQESTFLKSTPLSPIQ